MAGGYLVDPAALGAVVGSLRRAADGLDGTAAGAPQAPDAGAASEAMAEMLAVVVGAGGALVGSCLASADRVVASQEGYVALDEAAADVFGGNS